MQFVEHRRNMVGMLTGMQLGSVCSGHSYEPIALKHTNFAQLLINLERQLRLKKYRAACGTLERLESILCLRNIIDSLPESKQFEYRLAIQDFVRLGGVRLLRLILSISSKELDDVYNKEQHYSGIRNRRTNGRTTMADVAEAGRQTESSFISLLAQIFGFGMDIERQHQRERERRLREEREQDDTFEADNDFDVDNPSAVGGSHSLGRRQPTETSPEDSDPPLERFSREVEMEEENNGEAFVDTEEDVYTPLSDEERITSQMTPVNRILERLINHPHQTVWLKNSLQKRALSILRETSFFVTSVSDALAKDSQDLKILFGLISEHNLFFSVVPLLEELTALHLSSCSLCSVDSFFEEAGQYSPLHTIYTSRLLGHVCYDSELNINFPKLAKDVIAPSTKDLVDKTRTVIENQTLVLSINHYVEHLMKILKAQSVLFSTLVERVLRTLPTAGGDSVAFTFKSWESIHDNDKPLGIVRENNLSEISVSSVVLASHQLDIFFTLSSLLSGWRKVDSQHICAKCGLPRILSSFIDAIPWSEKPVVGRNGFTYDIDSSMKLQLLKLVVNFADRKSSFKAMMLTPHEFRQALDGKFEHNSNSGVISKIISLILNDQGDSITTVWMCACVEAFLRGADPRFHWWVTQSGLTEYLLKSLAKRSCQQIFDLVSEIMKWEPRQLLYVEHVLRRIDHEHFFECVLQSPVDSSFFVRSLLFLSLNHPAVFKNECPILSTWFYSHLIDLICLVFGSVTVDSLDQDNFCCLTTACLLFDECLKNGLDAMDEIMRKREKNCSDVDYLKNVIALASFWRRYHIRKGAERLKLEQSSGKPMSFFQDAVSHTKQSAMKYLDSIQSSETTHP